MSRLVLEADEVRKRHTRRRTIGPFSFEVERGELIALTGHNGSGKSTLQNMVAGLVQPTSGTLLVRGAVPGTIAARECVSFVPDQPVLYDDISTREHLEYVMPLHGIDDLDFGVDIAERLGLGERLDDLPSTFSRGLRQKVALTLGLARPFDLLMLDEPLSGLDPEGKDALLHLLDDVVAAGSAVIVATHEIGAIDRFERVITLEDGALVFDGSVGAYSTRARERVEPQP